MPIADAMQTFMNRYLLYTRVFLLFDLLYPYVIRFNVLIVMLFMAFIFDVLPLYTCLSENNSDELMLCNSTSKPTLSQASYMMCIAAISNE